MLLLVYIHLDTLNLLIKNDLHLFSFAISYVPFA